MTQLQVDNLETSFFMPDGTVVHAVDDVSLKLQKGEALGLAGESGCGKTTLALSLMRLIPKPGRQVAGRIVFEGQAFADLDDAAFRREMRWKNISMIFQGALNALNPLFRVGDQIAEAIKIHEPETTDEVISERIDNLLSLVHLNPNRARNYPFELSGGMKQRIMTAMALACNPKLVIADEPTTALDVIVARGVMDLIKSLRKQFELSMILITHDLSVIAQTCDKVVIMYAGQIVEYTDVNSLFHNPFHPYSKALISAFPSVKGKKTRMMAIEGSPPSLIDPPLGCRFAARCPTAKGSCRTSKPVLVELEKDHFVACHSNSIH